MNTMTQKVTQKSVGFVTLAALLISGCATHAHEMTRQLLEGNEAALRGDYTTAANHYEAALEVVPASSAAKRNLGIVLVKSGSYKKAKEILTEVAPQYLNDVEVFYFLGEACRGLEEFQQAAGNYQKALRIQSDDHRVQKALAWTWHKMGDYDRALLMALPMLKKAPSDLQLRLIVGSTYNRQKKFQETIDLLAPLEKAQFQIQSKDKVSADSERALLKTALADAYSGAQNCERGGPLFNEVLKTRPFLATALTGSARCDLRVPSADGNSNQRALTKLERAVKSDPDAAEAHFLLGKLSEKLDKNRAIFYYRRFLLLAKDDLSFGTKVRAARSSLAGLERKTATSPKQ